MGEAKVRSPRMDGYRRRAVQLKKYEAGWGTGGEIRAITPIICEAMMNQAESKFPIFPESLKATISDKQKYTNVLYDVLAYRAFFQTLFREISICKPQLSRWFAIDISS